MPHVRDRVDVTIYRDPGAYTAHPCVARLASGDLLVAFNEGLPRQPWLHPPKDPRFVNLMARSKDSGRTWGMPRAVPGYEMTGVECPSIVQLSTGEVLLVQWRYAWYPLETARKLWRQPGNPHDIHLVRLADGRLLTIHGVRRALFGIRACLSNDDGVTWDSQHEIVVRDDLPNGNLGYPTAVELPDGRIFAAYYGEDDTGLTCILGSSFRLP